MPERCFEPWLAAVARRVALGLLLAACLAAPAGAQDAKAGLSDATTASSPGLDPPAAVRASQAAVGTVVGEHVLLDRNAQPVRLSRYRGKPLLVSFVYTGCFQVCPANTRALQLAVRELEGRFGADRFNVISIGFNQPADSPQAMKAFAAQHGIAARQWDFLSPPAASVEPLTREFGFSYRATPAGFDHVVQLTIVDAQGRIARQVYGDETPVAVVGATLAQLLDGAPAAAPSVIDGIVDRVRILCTVYDPQTGTYRVDYGLALEIAGGVTFLVSVLLYFLNEWRVRRALRLRA